MPGGGCCSCCSASAKELTDSEEKPETEEEKSEVKKNGFTKDRHTTDFLCLIIWVAHVVLFFVLTFWGMQDGNPSKLYQPRDYQGAYCGVESNWNNGPNLKDHPKQSYMMNVTSMTDLIAKQFLCSPAAHSFLVGAGGLSDPSEMREYESACCLIPNQECQGSLSLGTVIDGNLDTSNVDLGVITNKMGDLTNQFNAFNLWSTVGVNQGAFNNIWSEAFKNFVKVCVTDCNVTSLLTPNSSLSRTYQYKPHPDQPLYKAWVKVSEHFAGTGFMRAFNFTALPPSLCPYPAEYCVPTPGVGFAELTNGYCSFQMGADLVNAVGGTMASTFETIAGDNLLSSLTETFGALWGDFEKSIDTFVIVSVCCFVIGFVYLVILRFTVKFCVWFAIVLVFLCLIFGGGLSWVASVQCKGTGLFNTAHQTGVAVVVAGTTAASNLVGGNEAVSEDCDSSLTVRCSDYRGVQTRSRSGYLCQAWDSTTPWNQNTYKPGLFPNSGLNSTPGTNNNYCRNPFHADWANTSSEAAPPYTIWCFTTNTEVRWQLCSPIGVIAPQCEHGYAVSGESSRKALEILGYVIWSLAGVWVLMILCFLSRIRLAIALNSVAARFLAHTPTAVFVPIIQAIVGCIWVLVWMLLASFLLSQVPDDYMPTGHYATYAEAYGTNTTAGACTYKWPTGFVWQTAAENCDLSDPLVPKCWKCAPPRFIFDWRFAVVFFSFLWNNAFLIALGQCMIAGAVGVWFFQPNSEKGNLTKGKALRTANWNVWRYHAGSLAFGSFILALVQFIRYLMKYLEQQAKAQKNRVMVWVFRVLQCVILCFERFIQFLNKNAYIQVAIRGTSFCKSARKAFNIIMSNFLRFGTVAVLGYVIHCIGYVFIMAATLVVGYFLLLAMHPDISPVIPMIIYGFMSYVVGMLFMNVFGLAVDTCLQCVIFAEEEGGDGDYVPDCLRKVIDRSKAGKDPE